MAQVHNNDDIRLIQCALRSQYKTILAAIFVIISYITGSIVTVYQIYGWPGW